MRFKVRIKTEEFWYGSGLPERFVDLSSFEERVAAERRVDALIQQAALQDDAVGADVELAPITPAGTPWVSVEVGDMVRIDGQVSGTEDHRVVDLGWSLQPSGQVICRPVVSSTKQLYADRIERSLARVGNGGLGGAVSNIDSVRGELPTNLPGGVFEQFSNELTWHKEGPVDTGEDEAASQRVDRPTRYCTYNWTFGTPPTDPTAVFQINKNGTMAHSTSSGGASSKTELCYIIADPGDRLSVEVATADMAGADNLVLTVIGTNRV